MAKAREGVSVRVLYDWLGALRRRVAAGSGGGCAKPASRSAASTRLGSTSPFGWVSRDHRKALVGRRPRRASSRACASGRMWLGDPERGPRAVARHRHRAAGPRRRRRRARVRRDLGASAGADSAARRGSRPRALAGRGDVAVRVVATTPATRRAVPAGSRWSPRWPASVCGSPTPTSPARARTCRRCARRPATASTCGCWCPGAAATSRSSGRSRARLPAASRCRRPRLRVERPDAAREDRRGRWALWSRVGSSNLNLASWLGNCELDV